YDESYRFFLEFLGKRTPDHGLALQTTRYLLFEPSKGIEPLHFGTSAPRPYYVRHPFRPTPLHLVALPDSSIHGGYHPIHQPIAG
ncbi:hypothetical protein, partial [Burkholderia pseudomallei]|uniref:hypothetical protein n=1 Tax=Burkholderia pseudomallei TaxID=28450 RepID=UPI0019402AF0